MTYWRLEQYPTSPCTKQYRQTQIPSISHADKKGRADWARVKWVPYSRRCYPRRNKGTNILSFNSLYHVIWNQAWSIMNSCVLATAFNLCSTAKQKRSSTGLTRCLTLSVLVALYEALNRRYSSNIDDIGYQVDAITNKQNKLRCLSPQANYTDRATAACRRS
jgi:hypothetical protein